MVRHVTGTWAGWRVACGLTVIMALAAAADVDADDTGRDEPTVWVGQFEPAIVDNLSSRETRPEAVRQIIIDRNQDIARSGPGGGREP